MSLISKAFAPYKIFSRDNGQFPDLCGTRTALRTDSKRFRCQRGWDGWGVSEALEGFVTSLAGGYVACSCLGARGGEWFRRLGPAHPRKGDFVGWMRALELVDQDDLAREILPAFANYWGAEHSDVFTLDRCS
jgi:hypothetical protein